MIIKMVRHGQTEYNKRLLIQGRIDNPLNDTGKTQALEVSKMIKDHQISFDAILSSPLSRALETAFIIKENLKHEKPIHVIQRFVERDFNQLDGVTVEKGMPLVRQKGYTHPGYEDDRHLVYRVINQALKLEKSYGDQTVLCVAHSHVIKAMLVFSDPNQFDFATYRLDNGDVITLEIKNQKLTFIEHKKTTH